MKIMTTTLEPTQTKFDDGKIAEYQWTESSEVEGADGWDNVESFVNACVDNIEIVKNLDFTIHNMPVGAVVVTPEAGEEGHMTAFSLYWAE